MYPLADVLQFRRENRKVHAQIVTSPPASLTAAELQVVRAEAWEKFLLATKAMVTAQDAMNDAHRMWLDADIQMFATIAAERLKP